MIGLDVSYSQLPFEEIRILYYLIYISIFSYYDIKNDRTIPDNIVYLLTGLSFIFLLFYPPTVQLYALTQFLIIFSFVFILYKIGQIGLGEAFSLSTIALLFPFPPAITGIPSTIPFVFFVFLFSGTLFSLFMILYILKNINLRKILKPEDYAIIILYIILISTFFFLPGLNPAFVLIVTILFASSLLISLYREEILETFVHRIPTSQALDEVFAYEFASEKEKKVLGKTKVLTQAHIKKLLLNKIKEITIYKMIPFSPFILGGFILSLFFSFHILI